MIIDAGTYLGTWPFRPVEGTMAGLARMMRENGIRQAVVSPLDGLFHEDPEAANERVLRQIRGRAGLWVAPIVNLRIADWRSRLEALARRRQVRAVRLAPTFHGYPLAEMGTAAAWAGERSLAVVVQLRLSDERFHPAFLDLSPASLEEVVGLAEGVPARWVVSAARLPELTSLGGRIKQRRNLWLDTSHVDGLNCMRRACEAVGPDRLLFSTCWPFFYARSSVLKIEEAGLPAKQMAAVMSGNAAKAFGLSLRA
jgi:hypothetical protein